MTNQLDATIAKRYDITVKQNQTFNPIMTLLDDSGGPINLDGSSVKMSIRQSECGCNVGCDAFDQFSIVHSQDMTPQIGGASMNVLQFFDTIVLSPGSYKYDLLVEYPSGLKQYILTGIFRVKKSYTSI